MDMKYLPGRVLLRFGFIRHTKTLVSESSCSLRSTGEQLSKCHRRPFFRKKVLQRNLAKFRVKYEINPLSNLNLAWEICEAFFCWLFFYLFVLSFWAEFTDCSALSQMKWYTASSNPKFDLIIKKSYLMQTKTFNQNSFNDSNYSVMFKDEVF